MFMIPINLTSLLLMIASCCCIVDLMPLQDEHSIIPSSSSVQLRERKQKLASVASASFSSEFASPNPTGSERKRRSLPGVGTRIRRRRSSLAREVSPWNSHIGLQNDYEAGYEERKGSSEPLASASLPIQMHEAMNPIFDVKGVRSEHIEALLQQLDQDPDSVLEMMGLKKADGKSGSAAELSSKSRNSRNRATYELGMWQKMLQVYQSKLKQSSLMKRGEGPQLSVVSPLDVLRQQLIYELARRRIKENREQIQVNDQLLKSLGKRSVDPNGDSEFVSSLPNRKISLFSSDSELEARRR